MPFASTVMTTDTSGAIAMRNAVVTRVVTRRSVALRGPSTTREIAYTATAKTTAVTTTAMPMPLPRASVAPPATTAEAPRMPHGAQVGSSPTLVATDGSAAVRSCSSANRFSRSVPVDISSLPRTRCGG